MEQELAYSFHLGSDKNKSKLAKKVAKENEQTEKLDNASKDISRILDNLKPTIMNKNNMVISNEDVQKIKNYTKDVKDTNKTIRSVNDLNIAIKDFEYSAYEVQKENRSLKYQLELKDEKINYLEGELSTKERIIDKLRDEKEFIKLELQKFKGFWRNLLGHFQRRICYDNNKEYKVVSDDLYRNGIFDDNDNEIANDIARKVKTIDEITNSKNYKKKNNDTRF